MYQIQTLDERIKLQVLTDFVSAQEARDIIELGDTIGYQRSTVVTDDGPSQHSHRTSSSCMLHEHKDHPVIKVVRQRACEVLKCQENDLEGFQLVRYDLQAEYRPHFDYFLSNPEDPRDQRVATILVYLRAPLKGGGTVFPALNYTADPIPGTAIKWNNCDPTTMEPNTLTCHGGLPVEMGTKIAMNIWQRGK